MIPSRSQDGGMRMLPLQTHWIGGSTVGNAASKCYQRGPCSLDM